MACHFEDNSLPSSHPMTTQLERITIKSGRQLTLEVCASSVKLAVLEPKDQILTVLSRQAEAKVFVSLGFIAIAILIRSAVVFLSIKISALTHDIMTMSLKHLDTLPGFVPVPQLNCHVITGGEDIGKGWVDDN